MQGTIEIGAVELFVRAGQTYLHACSPALGTILEAGRALAAVVA
jgi:hypothetical protein